MVVRFGGVRQASRHMNLSQPAVTARIQNLESSLAAQLFDRSGSGMTLTKRGETLLKYAEQFLQLGELIQRDVIDPKGIDHLLRIGVSETIVQSWLPEFVARLRLEYPNVEIDIAVDISSNLRDALLNGSLDLAILMGPVSEFTVDNLDLPEFPLGWYCATDADLPDDDRQLFQEMPVVTFPRNTRAYRDLKNEAFDRYGPGVSFFPSSSLSAGFRMVATGLGIGALPKAVAKPELNAGRIREFDPGWHPAALRFTASYLGNPQSALIDRAAHIAREVASSEQDKND